MKKFVVLALALVLTAGAAYANYCARDYVPAATLLVPYAVVSMNSNLSAPDANGYTTLFSVTNVSADAEIIHVTVWSAISTPVVDFDEVLSGYDVWTINFRDLLTGHFDYFDTNYKGFWSGTQGDAVSPFGPVTNQPFTSTLPGPFDTDSSKVSKTSCYNPYGYHPEYGVGIVTALANDIFVLPQWAECIGPTAHPPTPPWLANLDYSNLWFYVTVDVVWKCNQQFPDSTGYWYDTSLPSPPSPVTTGSIPKTDNVLIGEVVYANQALNYSEAMPAVHIEAQLGDANYQGNFYSIHYPNASNTNYSSVYWDNREPLATAFAFRYYDAGGASTQLLLWKSDWELYYDGDFWFGACDAYIYYAWDENEASKSRSGGPSGFNNPEPNVLPFETQSVPVDPSNFTGVQATNGWMLLILEDALDVDHYSNYEGWAGVRYLFQGYSAGLEAATMANTWCYNQYFPNLSYVFHYAGNWY